MKIPVDVRALYDTGKRLKEERERPVRLAVLVEIDAPDALVEAARAELHPKTAGGIVDVELIEPGATLRVRSQTDAVIVVAGSGAYAAGVLKDLRERAIPTAVLAVREDRTAFSRLIGHPESDVLVGPDAVELIRGPLAEWAMRRLEALRTALGHNFGFMRRAVAREAVRHCAWQNAAIGVVVFLPGADMPLMTLNQGRMLLQIAAAYGQPLETERIKELAAVVAGGFLFRAIAGELVGVVPGFGWAIKGGIAYSGTVAMGMAAIAYFEDGADLGGVVHALTEKAGEAVSRVREMRIAGHHDAADELALSAFTQAALDPADEADMIPPAPVQPTLLDVEPPAPTLLPPARESADTTPQGNAS